MRYLLGAAIALLITSAALAQISPLSEIRYLAQQSRHQEAYDRLQTYLQLRPEDEQGRLLKGVLLARLNRVEEAIEAFRDLASDHPDLAEPHNNLAVLYAAQGRYEEARALLEKAVALQPSYGTARENLGDIHARLAHLEYMRAYEIDGANTRALDKANSVMEMFDRIAQAEATLESAREEEIQTASTQVKPPPPEYVPPPLPDPADTASAFESPEPMPDAAPSSEPVPVPPPSVSARTATECFGVAGMRDVGDATTVAAWFEQRGAKTVSGVREEKEYLNYQVYLPPMGSREAARARLNRLKAAGIRDIALIYKGTLTNGISLGVYDNAASTKRRMNRLRNMGYDPEFRQRSRTRRVTFVEATSSEGLIDQEAFSRAFPDYSITRISCI